MAYITTREGGESMAWLRFLAIIVMIPCGVLTFVLCIPAFIIDTCRADPEGACPALGVVIYPWMALVDFVFP